MSWDTLGTLQEKIGLISIVVLVGFLVAKLVAKILVDVTVWSNTDSAEPGDDADAQEAGDDPADNEPGLHALSAYDSQQRLVDRNPTEDVIRATVRSLDWVDGFHHVWLVTSPGVYLEVSGSLDPDHGLSSSYTDLNNDIIKVINKPPVSVEHMEDLLVSFYLGDGRWEQLNDYE